MHINTSWRGHSEITKMRLIRNKKKKKRIASTNVDPCLIRLWGKVGGEQPVAWTSVGARRHPTWLRAAVPSRSPAGATARWQQRILSSPGSCRRAHLADRVCLFFQLHDRFSDLISSWNQSSIQFFHYIEDVHAHMHTSLHTYTHSHAIPWDFNTSLKKRIIEPTMSS